MPMPGVSEEVYPQIAERLGITLPHVWDLAAHDDEVASTLSLRQTQSLSSVTGVRIEDLIGCDAVGISHPIDPQEFCSAVRAHIASSRLAVSDFEDSVGWKVQEFVEDPHRLYDIANWDCLRDVASTIGVDPTAVLPRSNSQGEQK